ncbi:hypothetical protein M0804_013399 [Polistes exclamans]|nr:hypothetical protein M0804_013399 [Polistes exclamans]
MSNENLLHDEIQINYYRHRALSLMNIFTLENNKLFDTWLSKFEYTADIIEVPDNKMIEFFKKMVDHDVYIFIEESLNFVNFPELSYEEIIDHYLRYFDPNYFSDLHLRRFTCRNQYLLESIEKYANNLRKIYNKCNVTRYRKERLCEKFINGIRDDEIRTYLKNFSDLSFDEMVAKAIEYTKVNDITHYLNKARVKIHTYNPNYKLPFYKWLNKFEYIAGILGIPNIKMVRFFNKMVDDGVHKTVKEANPSINFSTLSYENIIDYYLCYFAPSYESNLHRRRFNCRIQYLQEPVENYANNLRKIYNKCNYTYNSEKHLCNKFVNGIHDDELKTYLNETPDLSFKEMVVKAIEFTNGNDLSDYLIPARIMISVYSPEKEEVFYYWLNKFEFVADFIGVPNTKMVEFFNKMIISHVHKSVKETYKSVKLSELPYDEIINYYLRYFAPSYENDLHRSRFTCRMQYENETIEKYADSLRKIHNKCNNASNLEEELCRQFIIGIQDDIVRTYLTKMPRLSYDEMVAFVISLKKEIRSARSLTKITDTKTIKKSN